MNVTPWTILVVDDDEATRESLRRLLELDDYEVFTASRVDECLREVDRLKPFAIVLDRKLEDGNGDDALPAIRELSPESSVVIATGFADVDSSVDALRLGVADYLVKPVQPAVLREALHRLRQQRLNELRLREAQESLRESEERLGLISRANRDAVCDCDLLRGTVWVNDVHRRLIGEDLSIGEPSSRNAEAGAAGPADEICATLLAHRFAGIDESARAETERSFEAALRGQVETWRGEYRILRADGSSVDVVDRAFILRNGEGRAIRVVGALEDVTERLRREAELRQAQKMDAIGRLAGGVAHDFNNLLAGVVSSCHVAIDLIQRPDGDGLGDACEIMKAMEARALRAASMTRQLLDFSRVHPRETSAIDLASVAVASEVVLRSLIGDEIELVVEVPREESERSKAWIQGDVGLLDQVIMNLAINARDAMPEGGRLTLSVALSEVAEHAASRDLEPGRYVRLEVADTGEGMSAEVAARAVEPFFTTKPQGEGTGLGLATVFGIVHDLSGHIAIESAPGEGTTVRLHFPACEAQAENAKGARSRPVVEGPCAGRILVVEDEDLLRMATGLQLRSAGYSVTVAAGPEEALAHLRSDGAAFDLLLSDIMMPGMSGPDLAILAQELIPGLAVLFMSGFSDQSLVKRGRVKAGVPILEKPFEQEELLAEIASVLAAEEGVNRS